VDAGYKSISKVEPTATTNCNADPACNNQLPGRKTLLTRQIAKNILIPSASNILNVDSVGCNSTGQYVNCFPYKFGTDECYDANDGESGCFDLTTYGGDEISIEGKYYNGKCVICNKDKGTLYRGAPITTYNYGSSLVAEMCLETCGADEGCDENLWDGDRCSDLCLPLDVCTNYCAGQLDTICVPFPTCSLKCGMSSGDYKKVCYENIATGDYHAVVLRNSTACNFNVFSTDIFVGQPRIKYSITQFLFVTGYSYGDSVPQQTAADGCSFEAWISQNYGDADGSRDFVPLTT